MNKSEFPVFEADAAAMAAARAHDANLTKPAGSLGRLEQVVLELAGVQRAPKPTARPAAALIFAADHPVTRHGVSPYPSSVTRAMLDNFARGGAAASVLARELGLPLQVVDVGVERATEPPVRDTPPQAVRVVRAAVADSAAGDLRCEDAMSEATFAACLRAGRDAVRGLGELSLLVLGEMGIGNTTCAAAVAGALLGGDPAEFVGSGTGASGEMLAKKREVVRDAVRRLRGDRDPMSVLRRTGGREMAALVGALAEAVSRRTAVLVDGFIVSTASLTLVQHAPSTRAALLFAHRSSERGHARVLAALGAEPLLDLGLRLGEASGALMAFRLVEQACILHARMASFESAKVPRRSEPV